MAWLHDARLMRNPSADSKAPMVTAKQLHYRTGRSGGRLRRGLIAVGLAVSAAFALYWAILAGDAKIATAYGAHIACSCRYIAGRALDQCRDDLTSGMGLVRLSEDPETKSVTARLPLLSGQTASYDEAAGCLLEPWER